MVAARHLMNCNVSRCRTSFCSRSVELTDEVAALVQSYQIQRGLPLLHPLELQMRLSETADDISALAVFLCSDLARSIGGQCIAVTAGEVV